MESKILTGNELPRTKVFEKSLSTKTLAEQNARSQVEFALVCKGIVKTIEDCNIKIEDFTRFLFKTYPKETAKCRKGFYNPRAPRTQEKGGSCSNSHIEKAPKIPMHHRMATHRQLFVPRGTVVLQTMRRQIISWKTRSQLFRRKMVINYQSFR
mmetsp:Transcript_36875/g.97958  ORF Transcript_36875/g.97958 Transcript_36875/m.97958 type:complete len:154 (+) Transcript_36875:284-745(+)